MFAKAITAEQLLHVLFGKMVESTGTNSEACGIALKQMLCDDYHLDLDSVGEDVLAILVRRLGDFANTQCQVQASNPSSSAISTKGAELICLIFARLSATSERQRQKLLDLHVMHVLSLLLQQAPLPRVITFYNRQSH